MSLDRIRKYKLLQEAKKRSAKAWELQEILFDKQKEFVFDNSKYKAAVCSRRSGKTTACGADLLQTLLTKPNSTQLYITLTRQNAKALVWREMKKLAKEYNLKLVWNNQDLTVTNPTNSAMIYCAGASHEEEIEKFRGYSLAKVYLDEAQSFKPWIEELIDEVLSPATWDTDGQIIVIGTPGPMPSGYFYDITKGEKAHGWKNFHWTIHDNPHILLKTGKTPDDILAADRKAKGLTENSPKYLREGLGLWVQDQNSLVYRYDPNINDYVLPPAKTDMQFVMGIDIGYKDSDAISILGFSKTEKRAYLIEEYLKDKQDITQLADEIKRLRDVYRPYKMVIDAGALGKKITEEMIKRHGLNLEAAEKTRKFEFIELMNDDLRSGRLMIRRASQTATDCMNVEWDIREKDRMKISKSYHGDQIDATLYAWRAGYHYLSQPKTNKEYSYEAQMNEFWAEEQRKAEMEKNGDWFDMPEGF